MQTAANDRFPPLVTVALGPKLHLALTNAVFPTRSDFRTIWSDRTGIEVIFSLPEKRFATNALQAFHLIRAVNRFREYRRERTLLRLAAQRLVKSLIRLTLKYKGEIWPWPDRENRFTRASGGDEGIRTLETVSRLLP